MTGKTIEQLESEIILYLNEDKDAYVVDERKYIVHVYEYDRIKALIRESLGDANDYSKDKKNSCDSSIDRDQCSEKRRKYDGAIAKKRCHDTIMLAGVRGSGKTTFMLSILNHIRNGKFGIELNGNKNAECEIETLPIFDPTLIEEKTHIFANIISMIKERVDRKAKRANCFNDDGSDTFRKFQSWEKSFRALAEGLPSIDGLGGDGFNTESWLDPQFVMDKGIRMAHAANMLEESFHDFVRQSLEFLGKKAFILCFDDVDTNFGKGWPVLEVLHKYLTTPQLITVLSGDPSLYSILIRDRQWKNFSNKLLRMECQTENERNNFKEVVAHLEEQYFLKLLKPQRRIFLENLYQLEQWCFGKNIWVYHNGNTHDEDLSPILETRVSPTNPSSRGVMLNRAKTDSLQSIYKRMFQKLGVGRSDHSDSYRFLASLPLRSQKQLLYAWIQQENSSKNTREFIQDIFDIFWSELTVKHVNVSSLRNNPENIAIHTLNYLVANDLLTEGYTLNQNFNDPLTNGTQFALGVVLHDQSLKDPSQVFEYWVRVCMVRELGVLMGDRVVSRGEGPSIRNFIEHCALAQSKSPRYLARFTTAYLRAFRAYNYNSKNLISRRFDEKAWHGTLPLYGLAEKTKGSQEERKNRIDYVLYHPDAKTHPLIRIIGSIPLSGATDHSKRALPIYSIYNIIGILGQLIGTVRRYGNDLDTATKEVAVLLYRDAQFREYPLPNWASSHGAEEEEGTSELSSNPDQFDQVVLRFSEHLVLWANMSCGDTVSSSLLGKVFTRLFYTLNNLDTQFHDLLLGNWLHRMVVIFLHSAVVVEAMEHYDFAERQLQLTNPVVTDKIFIDNLTKLNREKKDVENTLPFARWILACPLWDMYLSLDSEGSDLMLKIYEFVDPYVRIQFQQPIFVQAKKTASDYVHVFGDYNLVGLLNENKVYVKGYEPIIDAIDVGGKKKKKFTFKEANKSKLVDILSGLGQTMDKVKSMKPAELLVMLNYTKLSDEFDITEKNASDILSKVGKEITW